MSNDHIVEELRECATHAGGEGYTCNVMRRAAAEIKRLRSELQALKAPCSEVPEPVAWARQADLDDPSDCLFVSRYQYLATDYSVALYTAAPPAAQDVPGLLEALELGLQALNVAVSVYDVQLADRARKGLRQQIAAHRQAQRQAG